MRAPKDRLRVRRVRGWAASSALLTLVGCSKSSAPSVSVEPGDADLVAQTLAKVGEMDRLRGATMAAGEGKVYPRPDLGKCPVTYDSYRAPTSVFPGQAKEATGFLDIEPWDAARGDDLLGNISDELASIERLGIAFGGELTSKPGPRMFRAKSDARDRTRSESDRTRLRELADKTKSPNDFELVIDEEVAPKVTSETEFEPGILKGRFYVWDYDKSVITCMARVLVLSSEKLRIKVRGGEGASKKQLDETWEKGMRGDLREQALEQAKTRLFVAGPLPQEDDDDERDSGADSGKMKDAGRGGAASAGDAGRGGPGKISARDGGKP